MNKLLVKIFFAAALLCSALLAAGQSTDGGDQGQASVNDAASATEQEEPTSDSQVQQGQDSSNQGVAQVEDEEEASAGRFIPTEQLSQDLGASFPVDI